MQFVTYEIRILIFFYCIQQNYAFSPTLCKGLYLSEMCAFAPRFYLFFVRTVKLINISHDTFSLSIPLSYDMSHLIETFRINQIIHRQIK